MEEVKLAPLPLYIPTGSGLNKRKLYKLVSKGPFNANRNRFYFLPFLLNLLLILGPGCQSQSDAGEERQEERERKSIVAVNGLAAPEIAVADSQEVNGIHMPTGLIADEGYLLIQNNCSSCHSLDLVKDKRASREGWLSTIRWMQQTQGLWDLGSNEKPILDYLAKNYAPEDMGRRKQLTGVEWYILKE